MSEEDSPECEDWTSSATCGEEAGLTAKLSVLRYQMFALLKKQCSSVGVLLDRSQKLPGCPKLIEMTHRVAFYPE